jgi:hypothetical protein
MAERILILDFGSQYTQLIGANTTTCRRFSDGRARFFCFTARIGASRRMCTARKGRLEAKFWLRDCTVAAVRRVPQHELSVLQRQVRRHRNAFLEKWHAHFGR